MSKENAAQVSQVDAVLAKALEGLLDTFQAGKDFVLEQAPEVIQQLLMWKFTFAFAWVIISLLALVVISYFTWVKNKWMMDDYGDLGLGILPVIFGYIIFTLALFINAFEALKIYIAPKVWLLEYAAGLIR